MDNETAGSTTRTTGSLAAPRPALPASLPALQVVDARRIALRHGARATAADFLDIFLADLLAISMS